MAFYGSKNEFNFLCFAKKYLKYKKYLEINPTPGISKSLKIWEFWGANTNKVKPLNHFLWKIMSSPSYGT